MNLYNNKKIEHLKKAEGKYVGASTKVNNYEHGRNKAKQIAVSKSKIKALKKIREDDGDHEYR